MNDEDDEAGDKNVGELLSFLKKTADPPLGSAEYRIPMYGNAYNKTSHPTGTRYDPQSASFRYHVEKAGYKPTTQRRFGYTNQRKQYCQDASNPASVNIDVASHLAQNASHSSKVAYSHYQSNDDYRSSIVSNVLQSRVDPDIAIYLVQSKTLRPAFTDRLLFPGQNRKILLDPLPCASVFLQQQCDKTYNHRFGIACINDGCSETFHLVGDLMRHVHAAHVNNKAQPACLRCTSCESKKRFKSVPDLQLHLKASKKCGDINPLINKKPAAINMVTCPDCKKELANQKQLNRHQKEFCQKRDTKPAAKPTATGHSTKRSSPATAPSVEQSVKRSRRVTTNVNGRDLDDGDDTFEVPVQSDSLLLCRPTNDQPIRSCRASPHVAKNKAHVDLYEDADNDSVIEEEEAQPAAKASARPRQVSSVYKPFIVDNVDDEEENAAFLDDKESTKLPTRPARRASKVGKSYFADHDTEDDEEEEEEADFSESSSDDELEVDYDGKSD
jgi:hypothetical protein